MSLSPVANGKVIEKGGGKNPNSKLPSVFSVENIYFMCGKKRVALEEKKAHSHGSGRSFLIPPWAKKPGPLISNTLLAQEQRQGPGPWLQV